MVSFLKKNIDDLSHSMPWPSNSSKSVVLCSTECRGVARPSVQTTLGIFRGTANQNSLRQPATNRHSNDRGPVIK